MPGRRYSAGSGYRYGFNGKENDNEVKGEGNQIDYGLRVYDPRMGRFLSVDPLTKNYPMLTPYAYAENDVIRNIDLDGGEKLDRIKTLPYDGSGWDYLRALENGARNIANIVPNVWNSGVDTYRSLRRGTYIHDLTNELKATGSNIKQSAVSSWNYTWNTPIKQQLKDAVSPQAVEQYFTFAAGYALGNPTGTAKNLLQLESNVSTTLKTLTTRAAPFEGLGQLRAPAITPGAGESTLLKYGEGLASRKLSSFSNVTIGKVGEDASKYLWTIDNRGINIALEQTPAATGRGFITHTNISQSAYAGGEVWFTGENSVYINPKSARFGGASMTSEQYQAAIKSWEKIGYKVEAAQFNPPKK